MFLFLILGALIAEIAGTISGFGSSSIFLPIVNQVLDFHNALVLVAIYHIFGNVTRFSLFWKHWNKKIFVIFGVPSVLGTILGASLTGHINQPLLKIVLGIVLILFASYQLYNPTLRIQKPTWYGRVGGFLSGCSAGLLGTGGVLRGAFISLFKLPKEQYIATIASIALLVDITRIPLYFGQGFLDKENMLFIPILFIIAFIGTMIGKYIVSITDTKVLRKIILGGVIVLSMLLVYQGIMSV